MYTINVTWLGGPNWDANAPSSFNPTKKKTATEHLIETGGQSIDEAIMTFDTYRNAPIKVSQTKSEDSSVNWITTLVIDEQDSAKAEKLKNQLLENYLKKQEELKTSSSGYQIKIEVIS
jgi:deoxyhypusine synthase